MLTDKLYKRPDWPTMRKLAARAYNNANRSDQAVIAGLLEMLQAVYSDVDDDEMRLKFARIIERVIALQEPF